MTTISLKLPEELVSKIDAMARSKSTSRSALLREALEEKLKTMARKETMCDSVSTAESYSMW